MGGCACPSSRGREEIARLQVSAESAAWQVALAALCLPVSARRNTLVDMAEISCSKAWRRHTL